ncbi:MAG: outer membrane protein [Hyphomicrobium sp.]
MFAASNAGRQCLATILAVLGLSVSARAADLGTYQEAPVMVSQTTYNWSGLYFGAFAGAAFSDATVSLPAYAFQASASDESGVLGLYGGYQRQFGQVVIGAEVDWNAELSGEHAHVFTVRGRLGYDLGPMLIFGTLGWGYMGIDVPMPLGGSLSKDLSGLVVGGGVEGWLANHVSGRLEVLHFAPSQLEMPLSDLVAGGVGPLQLDADVTLVRAGVSYHLN